MKFLDHGSEAAFFTSLEIPAAAITVVVVGAIELFGAVSIGLGAAGRIGAVAVIPVMATAIVLAGPTVPSVVVLLSSLGIVGLETGAYSLWEPDERLVSNPDQ